jgi:hypothetical protein
MHLHLLENIIKVINHSMLLKNTENRSLALDVYLVKFPILIIKKTVEMATTETRHVLCQFYNWKRLESHVEKETPTGVKTIVAAGLSEHRRLKRH